ncbi:C-C motif chemokine 3 [Dicentrarchus labrax]|nr:C-C motif chemokine 3 [Dicentrarchus labrax]
MRFNTLFFLLFVSCLSLALAQVTYDDCCLKYVKRMSRGTQKHAVDYRLQVTDGGCNIPAVIFVMRKGRVFCTDPREKWVEELRERIDKRNPQKMPRSTIHDGRTEAEGDCLLQ